jgi:hypothetical protein
MKTTSTQQSDGIVSVRIIFSIVHVLYNIADPYHELKHEPVEFGSGGIVRLIQNYHTSTTQREHEAGTTKQYIKSLQGCCTNRRSNDAVE